VVEEGGKMIFMFGGGIPARELGFMEIQDARD